MKRTDQILKILGTSASPISSSEIAAAIGSTPGNIGAALQSLTDAGLAVRTGAGRSFTYAITEKGKQHVAELEVVSPSPATDPDQIKIGVFTNGELHIDANGKRLALSKTQASELIQFVCGLPNRLFAGAINSPPRSAFPGMVHTLSDEER